MKFAAVIDSSSYKWFLFSMQCCLIVFYPQENFFQNWSQSSQTLPLLYQLSLCNILYPLLFRQSSSGVYSISRNHFCYLSIRRNFSCFYHVCILSHDWLCNTIDCNLPGSSAQRIIPARTVQWVAISSSRGSSIPKDQTHVSCISSCTASRFFTTETSGKLQKLQPTTQK